MSTIITHAVVAVAISKICLDKEATLRFLKIAMLCSIIPDIDVLGFLYGVNYLDFMGHRGFTHSLVFALIVGVFTTLLFFPDIPRFSRKWWQYTGVFFLVTASHGFFDAMTNGGHGIAFFSPFDNTRYFLPWTPVQVAMIGMTGFFSKEGLELMTSEFVYIWIPIFVLWSGNIIYRKRSKNYVRRR